jgi:hypothetical protein
MKYGLIGGLVAAVVSSGCESSHAPSSPTAPSPTAPSPVVPRRSVDLQAGPHWFQMTGLARSFDPKLPPCRDFLLTRGGTAIRTRVVIAESGAGWVGRPLAGSADTIELAFTLGTAGIQGVPVTGSVIGTALDIAFPPNLEPSGVTASVGGPGGSSAVLEGRGEFVGSFLHGRIVGDVRFTDGQRVSVCEAVMWTLQPAF